MKVAIINNFPPDSGTGRVPYSLFESLKKIPKIKVDLICTHYLSERDKALPENKEVRFLHNFPYRANENLSRLLVYFVDPLRIPKDYDLYHIGNHMLGNYLYFLKPAVITVHDLLQFKYPEDRGDALSSRVYNTLLGISLRAIGKAEKVICVSNWTRREVLKKFNLPEEKVVTVYNGIDHGLFKPGSRSKARKILSLPSNKKIILHVGAETKRKNIFTLLKAASALLKEGLDVLLVRVGEKKPETVDLIKQLELGDKILHFENVSEEKLVKYYQAADVLSLPSFDEGFGFPVLEALACGCLVVCSNRGPLPEVGGKAVTYIDPEDKRQLAEVLKAVLWCNTLEYRTRVEEGLGQAKKFSWGKAAKETLEVYQAVLGKPRLRL